MDVLTQAQRSHCMSRIRGRDTTPEIGLRRACRAVGLRYRIVSKVPGKPDMVFPGQRVAVFVDGCFWHGCPAHYQAPVSRADFWRAKVVANQRRDERITEELRKCDWTVIRFWEHDLETDDDLKDAAQVVSEAVRKEP